jgi:uncharacterized FlaG/YvyC family protein
MAIQVSMINTQAMVNPHNTPNMVDKGLASVAGQPHPVPSSVKVAINREPVISTQELDVKIAQLNEAMVASNQAIVFSKDSATGKDVVLVSNKSTGELIRQMPSVEALKATHNIDKMLGLIFNRIS